MAAIPAGLSFAEAAAVPEAFITAYDALVAQSRLAAGETALVHAVGSGVGTAAVQIIRAIGARAIGTARTSAKLDRARFMRANLFSADLSRAVLNGVKFNDASLYGSDLTKASGEGADFNGARNL